MRKVDVRCPACSKRGFLEIPEEIISKSLRGVSAINVDKDKICAHSFVAYIDKNLAVRDCFLTDFQLELPQMETAQTAEDKEKTKDQKRIKLLNFSFFIPLLLC